MIEYLCINSFDIYKVDQYYYSELSSEFGSNIIGRYKLYQNNKFIGIIKYTELIKYFKQITE